MNETPYIQKQVLLEGRMLFVDRALLYRGAPNGSVSDFFAELYRFLEINYLKFFKMDMLSKTLFIASEALLHGSALATPEPKPHVALVLYNSHSSLDTDRRFQDTIKNDAFFPSPSLFVYTLPNVALGEVAIRNHFMGENCTFMAPNLDAKRCVEYVKLLINRGKSTHVVCGWFDFINDREEAKLYLVSNEKSDKIFNINNL